MYTESQNRLKQLVIELGISEAQFLEYTGLSLNELNNKQNDIHSRLINDIGAIFIMLDAWFETSSESWEWYTEKPISGFGNKTPSQVVLNYRQTGAAKVIHYIHSKNLGGFE